jgi:Uma2 family endonuclease
VSFQSPALKIIEGIKIPDVMWFHPDRSLHTLKKSITPAPDICVEIFSSGNDPELLKNGRCHGD